MQLKWFILAVVVLLAIVEVMAMLATANHADEWEEIQIEKYRKLDKE